MIRGLPASILLHGTVLVAGSVAWPYMSRPIETNIVAVPIELLELSELASQRLQVERQPEEEPELEPETLPEEEFFEEEPAPEPEEDVEPEEVLASEEAPPAPEPEDVVSLPEDPPEPEPEPEDEPEPEPEEQPLREAPDPLDDILDFAENTFDQDLLDKTPREETRSAPSQMPELTDESVEETPSEAQAGAGDRQRNTQSVINIIRTQMEVCWDDVDDLPNPERLNVTVKMVLNRDGTLQEDVRLIDPARPPIGNRPMQVAIERALRAARKCAPYRLPEDAQDYYDTWAEVTLNIGPAFK